MRSAFSLLEMLIVISIIALLSSLIVFSSEITTQDKLEKSIRELENTMLQARAMAMASGNRYAVAFNIENAGDGKVFNNNHNKHWYQIVGPDKTISNSSKTDATQPPTYPWRKGSHTNTNHSEAHKYLVDFLEAMDASFIGERKHLEPGIRFLALSDEDPGSFCRAKQVNASYPANHPFPRPWYGHYDSARGRLFSWGGYDPDIDLSFVYSGSVQEMSGFDYSEDEAENFYDPNLDTNINPSEVNGYISENGHRYCGATAFPADTSVLANKPRPVINGLFADFMIVFNQDGSAFKAAFVTRGRNVENKHNQGWLGAIRKQWPPEAGYDSWGGRAKAQMTSFVHLTGGYHITLAKDIDPESDIYTFNRSGGALTPTERENRDIAYERINEEDAVESLYPFARLFINSTSGLIKIKRPDHPDCKIDITSQQAYP